MTIKARLHMQGSEIAVRTQHGENYISLTDMTRDFEGGSALIENWLKNKDTLLFLGAWEKLHNPEFSLEAFEELNRSAGRNSFYLSTKRWVELTGAKGIVAVAGKYGGTFAHHDIAFEFGTWLSPEFKLYLITEFQRLKELETSRESQEWQLNRVLSKLNYRIHTDAVKEFIIPSVVTRDQAKITYANEADIINMAMFGETAKQWRDANKGVPGNVRDYATPEQLLVVANLESYSAVLIREGLSPQERLKKLNEMAIDQLTRLTSDSRIKALESKKADR